MLPLLGCWVEVLGIEALTQQKMSFNLVKDKSYLRKFS